MTSHFEPARTAFEPPDPNQVALSPQFDLVAQQSRYRSFFGGLTSLRETESPIQALCLGAAGPWPKDRRPVAAFLSSFLIHFAAAYFFCAMPLGRLLHRITGSPIPPEPQHHYSVVIYHLQPSDLADYLPLERPPGPGGAPGRGAPHHAPAARASTSLDPRVSVISEPERPDNDHQTILEPAAPPKLKITHDVPLPDLLVESAPPILEAPKPVPVAQPAPMVSLAPQPPLLLPETKPEVLRPAPPIVTALPPAPPPLLTQSLTAPLPPPPQSPPPAPRQIVATRTSAPGDLVSLSVNPAPLKEVLALPVGNREGAFSISPAGNGQGSSGGAAAGDRNSGTATGTSVGDLSISTGPGNNGGGGPGGSPDGAARSISGRFAASGGTAEGSLPPLRAEALVYPVDTDIHLRKPALVVSTGPGGGGGLGVYGVLHGPRIYTIYLVMAPRSWILQYCTREDDPRPAQSVRAVQIQLQPVLTPPAAVDKFDFHRPVLEKANETIILHGVIRENGTVEHLRVLRGLDAMTDQAAIAAFSRWKFSPALRGGKPVAVEVLVGIPAA